MLEMKQLDNSIFLLESSPMAAIKVEYCDNVGNYSAIENNATKAIIDEKYGSINQFFESLYKKGIRKLRITDRKSNGSSFKTIGKDYEVTFEAKEGEISSEPIAAPESVNTIPTMQIPNHFQNYGMNAPGPGLGMVEIHRIHDYDRLVTVNQKLEVENAALKARNEALRDENLRNELLGTKSVEKAEKQNALLAQASPILLGLIEKFQTVAPVIAGGLAGAENFSPLQKTFLSMVQTADQAFLSDLLLIANGMSNPDFDTEITELLKKFNLIIA